MASEAAAGPDRLRRLLLTAGVVAIYRGGCQIPLPGLDPMVLQSFLAAGLSAERVSIFGLGVAPVFSVLMIVELLKTTIPPLSRWEGNSAGHARHLAHGAMLLALALTAIQAIGIADSLAGIPHLVEAQDGWFAVRIAATLVASTALLMWLGERVTRGGIGNGFWLLLMIPTLTKMPYAVWASVSLAQQGAVGKTALIMAGAFLASAIALLVSIGTAKSGAAASLSNESQGGQAHVDFAIVWPPLLANFVAGLMLLPFTLFLDRRSSMAASSLLAVGGPVHLGLIAISILLFTYGRARSRAVDAGARPIWITALAQIMVCIGAELLTRNLGLPFALNGSWLIVVVTLATSWLVSLGIRPSSIG